MIVWWDTIKRNAANSQLHAASGGREMPYMLYISILLPQGKEKHFHIRLRKILYVAHCERSREAHRRVRQSRSWGPETFQSQTAGVGFAFLHPSTAQSMAARTRTENAEWNKRSLLQDTHGNAEGSVNEGYLPEPLDDSVVGAVAALVVCVFPPVVDVHVSQTAHEQLSNAEEEPWLTVHDLISTILTAGRTEHSPPARSHQRSWSNLGGSVQRIPKQKHSNV